MDIQELRREIDGIDAQLLPLFCQRMEIAAQVADYKKENGLPIFVPGREREILDRVAGQAGEDMSDYAKILYNTLFELSRAYQGGRNSQPSPLRDRVLAALDKTPPLFPKTASRHRSCSHSGRRWPVRVWKVPSPRSPQSAFSTTL